MSEEQKPVVLFRRRRALFWDQVYGGAPWPVAADPRATERQINPRPDTYE